MRRLVLLTALLVASVALPGGAVAATGATPTRVLVPERGSTVELRRTPAGTVVARAAWRTPFGSRRRLRVVEQRGDWYRVESDVLGNGRTAWVPVSAPVRVTVVRASLEADLSERLLTYRVGSRIVFRRRVSIGAGTSPTPVGRFHVTDRLRVPRWGLGCCVLVISGSQPRLPAGWDGGDRLAIHGRPGTAPIGSAVSAGCLQATDATVRELIRTVPLGAPVVIHP